MQFKRQNRDLEVLNMSPNKRFNTQVDQIEKDKVFEFQDIDSSIHYEPHHQDSRSKMINSLSDKQASTENCKDTINDMLGHQRSSQIHSTMIHNSKHFDSLSRESFNGSRNTGYKQMSQNKMTSSNRSQRSILKYGIQSSLESEILAKQLQSHTTQAALIATKACSMQAQLMEKLSSKRHSKDQENRMMLAQKLQKSPYAQPQRLVSNEASNCVNIDYGGGYQNKLNHKSIENRRKSTSPSLSQGSGSAKSKISAHSGGYMIQSSHRVRRTDQKFTKPTQTLKNYQKPIKNLKQKECQEPQILSVTRKQVKNRKRSPEFNRQNHCSNLSQSTKGGYISRKTDDAQQKLFDQANQIYEAQDYHSFAQIAVKQNPASINIRNQKQADEFFIQTQLRQSEERPLNNNRWNNNTSAKKEAKRKMNIEDQEQHKKRKNLGLQYLKSFGKIKSPEKQFNSFQQTYKERESDIKVISFAMKGSFDNRKLRQGYDSRKTNETNKQPKIQRNQSALGFQQTKVIHQLQKQNKIISKSQEAGRAVKRAEPNPNDKQNQSMQEKPQKIVVNSVKHVQKKVVISSFGNQPPVKKKQQFYETQETQNMKEKLRQLHQKFGAVMKGYKTRRIYHNNKMIKKFRVEFRELIQFAFILKQDIKHAQTQLNGHLKVDHIQQLLLTSLRDLIHKRQQFNQHFSKLLYSKNKEWNDEFKQLHMSTGSFGAHEIDEKFRVPWIQMCKPKEVQIFMPMESLETMMTTYNQSEISQAIILQNNKRSSKSQQTKVQISLKKKVNPQFCKQFINANAEDQLRIKQKAQDHANQSSDARLHTITKSIKQVYLEESKSQLNLASRSNTINMTQLQSGRKMNGEQIKNQVLNPEDRRKKIEKSISKYSRERNNNVYDDPKKDQVSDNQNNMTQNYQNIMTFGNTQKQSLCETEFKNSQPNLQIQISGENYDIKTENTSPKLKCTNLERQGSQLNFGNMGITSTENKSSSPVRKFKYDLATENSYSTMPAAPANLKQTQSYHQQHSSIISSKVSQKSEGNNNAQQRSGGRTKELETSAQRQFLRKTGGSASQTKRLQYDPKRSIHAAKIQKIQKQLEMTTTSIESSGYNPQIIKNSTSQNQKINQESIKSSVKVSAKTSLKQSMLSSPDDRLNLNPVSKHILRNTDNQVTNYKYSKSSKQFVSKIPKLTVSQERLKCNQGSVVDTNPVKTMILSKSAIIRKKPANDSNVSSGVGSQFVSPYRVSRMQKKEKILESFDNRDLNQKIKALNQQYVQKELNVAQNMVQKNSSFSPILNQNASHNNSIKNITIHRKVQCKNMSNISYSQNYNNVKNPSQSKSSVYTDIQQVPMASPGPQKSTFEVKDQSMDLSSVNGISQVSPSQFKNIYYYKNINNYLNDSPKREAINNVQKHISIETSPQPCRLTTQKEKGERMPIAITSPDNDFGVQPIQSKDQAQEAENENIFQLQQIPTEQCKKTPTNPLSSNLDFRFDTFNNNDFDIHIFEQDNTVLDMGQSSNFNSFSHQLSKRTADSKKDKNCIDISIVTGSDIDIRSKSTFRIQPQIVTEKTNNIYINENQDQDYDNEEEIQVLHIKFNDQTPVTPKKSNKKSPKKQKSPNKENEGSNTAVKVKQSLGAFVQKSMKDKTQRRRSKADRKQKSVERFQKSNKSILVPTQNLQHQNIQISNINNVMRTEINLEADKNSIERKSCASPEITLNITKQIAVQQISLLSQSPPQKRSNVSASKSSNFNYNNVMNIKPVLSEKQIFQSTTKSVKSFISGHSASRSGYGNYSSGYVNNQIPLKTPERKAPVSPKNMEMNQTLQTIQQMLQSVQQQQDQNASPTSRQNMQSMIKCLEKQVGTILQTQLAKQQIR